MDFRSKLSRGERLLGVHINACDPTLTELLGRCGFDYLWIDTEHTAIDYQTLQYHLIAARAAGCPALVRVPWNESYLVKRVADQGPDGIIFPMLRGREDAERAMDACLYPPRGTRSFGPIRASGYGMRDVDNYLSFSERALCRLIQVEHIDAVNSLDAILTVPGIDGVVLGPCDLSGSVGRLGQTGGEPVSSLIAQTIAACRAHGIPVGVSLGACDGDTVRAWWRRGVQFVSVHSEYSLIRQGARNLIEAAGK